MKSCSVCGESKRDAAFVASTRGPAALGYRCTLCEAARAGLPFRGRFWATVKKSDGCWEWGGAIIPEGYGQVYTEAGIKPASRVAVELLLGNVPESAVIGHMCGNRSCVRPDPEHVWPIANSALKRRAFDLGIAPHGEKAPNAKLTEAGVLSARRAHGNGATIASLARTLGVSRTTMAYAIHGRTWSRAGLGMAEYAGPVE